MNVKLIVGATLASAALVGVVIALSVVMTNKQDQQNEDFIVGDVHLELGNEASNLQVLNSNGMPVLKGDIGRTMSVMPEEVTCTDDLCLEYSDRTSLKINTREEIEYNVVCEDFQWDARDCREIEFEDCFDMRGAHWYGGTQIKSQLWPLEKWVRQPAPYVTGDSYQDEYGGVQERYWLSSAGVALYAQFEVPLWISMNHTGDNALCFRSQFRDSPYEAQNIHRHELFLNYSICRGDGIKEVHQYMLDNYLGKPDDIPDELLFKYPIWSTWAQYKRDINQTKVMEYANNIVNNDFKVAQLELDDDWEYSYGALDFNLEKFPDPKKMVDDVRDMGMRMTIWIHPFVDLNSDFVWLGGILFHYMQDPGGLLPALTTWWNGVATHVDFTSARTRSWWTSRLQALQDDYGIHSFKFDAGESDRLPASYIPFNPFNINPSEISTLFAEVSYSLDTEVRSQEVRVAAKTQHLPVFLRMMDKDSNWGWDNGLKTVIPHALTYSVLGYPFVLPDMIGGNAYNDLPDRELYIRWVQLNAFLPGFQFSIAPWDYDQEVIDICKAMLDLHEQYSDQMIQLARGAIETGAPIVRPLWWIAPEDEVALTIDSEFLLGDDVLVAPVLDEGARQRDVYLPQGEWTDQLRGGTKTGGLWYRDYPVALDELPYFTKST